MNWDIFREIVQDYIKRGEPEKALEFMKKWNVVSQDTRLGR